MEPINMEEARYSGFWIRLLAHILDAIIVYAAIYVIGLVMLPDVIDNSSAEEQARMMGAMNRLTLLAIFLGAAYEIGLCCSKIQGTLGKRALGMKVVDANGNRISLLTSVFRYFGKILSWMILCIGFIMIAFSKKKRGLHDNLANTYIVKA